MTDSMERITVLHTNKLFFGKKKRYSVKVTFYRYLFFYFYLLFFKFLEFFRTYVYTFEE